MVVPLLTGHPFLKNYLIRGGKFSSIVIPLLQDHPFFNENEGGSISYVIGSKNSYKPITNTVWVCIRLCKLQPEAPRSL